MAHKCNTCFLEKEPNEFPKDSRTSRGFKLKCTDCVNKSRTPISPEKLAKRSRNRKLLLKYGITVVQFEKMARDQNGCCKICGRKCDDLTVDHDHRTLTVRGLLCNPCNWGLGQFQDNIQILEAAIAYLKEERVAPDLYTMLMLSGRTRR